MKSFGFPVPDGKLGVFHEILCSCGGRYLSAPIETPDQWGRYRVDFEYDSSDASNEHSRRWYRAITPIQEIRKDQIWRLVLRRLKLGFLAG